jgi:hypothetical protein
MPRLLVGIVLVSTAASAGGITLQVDASASGAQDGTASHPFGTISAAVSAAASDGSGRHYTIAVAPGVYGAETLPIQLSRANVSVAGSTQFIDDAQGRPQATVHGTETVIRAGTIRPLQPYFYVTAEMVSVSGFSLQQHLDFGIALDGARGFLVARNDVENVNLVGILAIRGASGRIENNLLVDDFAGIDGTGGDGSPSLAVSGNTSQNGQPIGSIFSPTWDSGLQFDLAASGSAQLTPVMPHPSPTSLTVEETNNVFSNNRCVGSRFSAYSRFAATGDAATQQTWSTLSAQVWNNVFESNNCNAIAVDAGNDLPIAGVTISASLTVRTWSNSYDRNGNSGHSDIVASTEHFSIPYLFDKFDMQFVPLHASFIEVAADSSFDYWNPAHDPLNCADAFGDTLVVNGRSVSGTNLDAGRLCPQDR